MERHQNSQVVKWIDTTLFGGEVKETRTGSNTVLTTK